MDASAGQAPCIHSADTGQIIMTKSIMDNQLERFELVAESDKKKYYASNKGYILSVNKKTYSEKKLKNYLKSKRKNPPYVVKIDGKEYLVKHLIAKAFLRNYKGNGSCILHKDGNKKNCSADNLIIVPKKQINKITGAMSKSHAVTVCDLHGTEQNYSSIRKAAAALHVSYQTLLDYMKGKYSCSVLDGYVIHEV